MINISQPYIDENEIKAVENVLKSGQLAQGEKVKYFEEEFSKYLGVKYSVATSSGTTALQMALLANGIGKGDEVITTGFTFVATINSILSVGAKPVLVDINTITNNIDETKIEKHITKNTKAIMPVHLYGLSCDMSVIEKISKKYNLMIIEDACQSLGAEFENKKVGSYGAGCFSFYPTKNITTGEGGMVCTDNENLYEKLLLIRNHGMGKSRYDYIALGYNFRMTELQAAIGISQLEKLDLMLGLRIKNARIYDRALSKYVEIPFSNEKYFNAYNQYTIRTDHENRDKLQNFLDSKNIQTVVYYPNPVSHFDHVRENSIIDSELLNSDLNSKNVLSLPVHPKLTVDDLDFVISSINEFFNE